MSVGAGRQYYNESQKLSHQPRVQSSSYLKDEDLLEALDNLASFDEVIYTEHLKFQLKGDVKSFIDENVKA